MPSSPRKTAARSTAKKTAAKKTTAKKTTARASAITKPETGAEILARVQPRLRVESTKVCLRAELIAEFHRENEKLASMQLDPKRLAGSTASADAVKAQARVVRKIEEQIEASQVEFTFRGLTKDAFRALVDDNGPRKGNNLDAMVGYNRDAVLDQLVRLCLIAPVFDDCTVEDETGNPCDHEACGSWQQLVKVINPSEWGELRDTANEANSAVVDVPKSELASLILDRRSGASQ